MKRKTRNICLNVAILIFLLIFAVSGVTLVRKLAGERKNAAEMESLAGIVNAAESAAFSPSGAESAAAQPESANRESRLEGYAKLREQNEDMAGWLCIPGTAINYPVMQSPGKPDYYLKHDFSKEASSHGVPYLAEGCELSEDCSNRIIYGHHMRDGSMFASLQKYEDEEYFKEHPVIQFDTLEEASDYQVAGVLNASAIQGKDSMFDLASAKGQEGYEAFIDTVKSRSFYETGITPSYGEPLITLITCEYSQKEGRLLIVAVKQNHEEQTYVKAYTDFLLNAEPDEDDAFPIAGYYLFDLDFNGIPELGVLHDSGGSMGGYFTFYYFDGNTITAVLDEEKEPARSSNYTQILADEKSKKVYLLKEMYLLRGNENGTYGYIREIVNKNGTPYMCNRLNLEVDQESNLEQHYEKSYQDEDDYLSDTELDDCLITQRYIEEKWSGISSSEYLKMKREWIPKENVFVDLRDTDAYVLVDTENKLDQEGIDRLFSKWENK